MLVDLYRAQDVQPGLFDHKNSPAFLAMIRVIEILNALRAQCGDIRRIRPPSRMEVAERVS